MAALENFELHPVKPKPPRNAFGPKSNTRKTTIHNPNKFKPYACIVTQGRFEGCTGKATHASKNGTWVRVSLCLDEGNYVSKWFPIHYLDRGHAFPSQDGHDDNPF